MELIFMLILLTLVLLFYFSNRNNNVNKWCAYSAFIFWLGVEKEAVLFNIIPRLESLTGNSNLSAAFAPAYSIQTWALYSLAMPTAFIYSLYLYNPFGGDNSAFMRKMKLAAYAPAVALSFYFTPLAFRAYQVGGLSDGIHSPFWVTYSLYNLIFVIVHTILLIKGIFRETDFKARRQKTLAVTITLPAILYWYATVFPVHTLGIDSQFKLWRGNLIVILVCVLIFIVMSFKYGVMGLKLRRETYKWDSDMVIISKSAEYTSHILKNQTNKMDMCIDNLSEWFKRNSSETPKELEILSRSLLAFQEHIGEIKKLSEEVILTEEIISLREMLSNALPSKSDGVSINIRQADDIFLLCDRAHMTEVFTNIIMNALDAVKNRISGEINISCEYSGDRKHYQIRFSDNGVGMTGDELANIFTPYYTTKFGEKNYGLGLSYCKNVVRKHGGVIYAESSQGEGTAITVALPAKRISANGGRDEHA